MAALPEAFLSSGNYARVAPDAENWLDAGLMQQATGFLQDKRLDPADITITERGANASWRSPTTSGTSAVHGDERLRR